MAGEAFGLQEVMAGCSRQAKVLAVTSGKGGVGKTNIAVNLGICLAASKQRTILIDADFSLGNVDVIMDVDSRYDISHVMSGRKSIEEIIHVGPESMEIICGASGLEQLSDLTEFQRQRLLRELSKLQNDSDMIVVDTAAGISKSVVGFCLASDHVLVVTTPEASAMTDAYAMIKVLAGHKFGGRISVIVNMAETIREGKNTYQQISNVARRFLDFDVYDAGVLLRDAKLTSAVRRRVPVVLAYPRCEITSSLAALAVRLSRGCATRPDSEGFFKKVVDWFF